MIGRCVGETSLVEVSFISKEMPQVGQYVTLEYDNKIILGMIESMVRGSVSLNNEIYDPDVIEKIREIEGDDYYIKGKVSILGDVNDNLKIPRTPAPPGTPIYIADSDILDKIFEVNNALEIGHLINQEDVAVGVDINKMVSRHLAILAMTGAGKSNTVSVIIDGLLKYDGCMLIFDMHSEYVDAEFTNGNVNVIEPIINPQHMEFTEMKKLASIPSNAPLQERYFRRAFNEAKKLVEEGTAPSSDFIEVLRTILSAWYDDEDNDSSTRKTIMDVLNKIEDLSIKYDRLLNTNVGDILAKLKPGMANVLDLGQVDENTAEVLVAHILRKSLRSRKDYVRNKNMNALSFPVFFIVEEAHILAPQNRSPDSKYWITRIAREGRKFGLGLCLVSQSPKSVDAETLSQANNMIILRLVEPKDQKHVQTASENLSEDLVKQLPSLNIGEALVLGLMTKVPTLVKINEFKGRQRGGDLNIIEQWSQFKKDEKKELEREQQELDDLGLNY
ncbi:ATP-binding protein [uncultured Methanobrevibacter sp.]|uniref:helicase HerA-like domain-containing protein n=1 Tax=uncultured Methanobrevibacter sp. TaxID=253161 RepID=UPI00262FDC0B